MVLTDMARETGFTLMELIVTIVVVSILVAIGVPSFIAIMQNNRAAAMTNEFVSSLNLARSEAIKQGVPVTVCASANANQTACGGAGTWTNGWIVFTDPDSDGTLASVNDRIKVREALPTGATFATTQSRVTYAPTGFVIVGGGAGAGGLYTLAATGCTGDYGRAVTISNTGRVAVAAVACP